MKKDRISITAQGIALTRALESEKPAAERICYDPYARQFISPAFYHFTRFFVDSGYAERRGPGVQAFLAARTRHIDEYLQACLADGIQQLVILGAGLDSRAYRFAGLQERVKVFEVDRPSTQAAKKDKVVKIFGKLPAHVVYVAMDFNRESLPERLLASGYAEHLKTAFIWEGVSMYLTAEAVDATLAFVRDHSGPGSSIIFDYVFTSVLSGEVPRGEAQRMHRYQRITGEGWGFGIAEGTIEQFMSQRGFYQIRNADCQFLKQAYFSGPNASREIAPVYNIVTATVAPK